MKVILRFSLLVLVVLLCSTNVFAQTQLKQVIWKPERATLLAKSTMLLVEYLPEGPKKGVARKYKLFDVALGKVVLETTARDYYGMGSRFVILDDFEVTVYDIKYDKAEITSKFKVKDIANTEVGNIEIIGFSSSGNTIFRQTGIETPKYYLYSIAGNLVRKLGQPSELYKSTFVPQTGMFDFMKEAKEKHYCYTYNPETDLVSQTGLIDSIPSKNIYRVQLSKNVRFAIYGCCHVYNMQKGKIMYSLPISNEDMDWNGNGMDYSGQRVMSSFSAKGDSVIVIKKMKENMKADEKVQVEIYSTIDDAPVKSFFIYHKGDVLIDADIPSGWAAFLGNGKVKVVHLTTKTTVREFSLITPDIMPIVSGSLPIKTATSSN